jgi:hypothetical protein
MKKCMICGCLDEGGNAATCPYDGEASWMECGKSALPGLELATVPVESPEAAPPKKRGRPKAS